MSENKDSTSSSMSTNLEKMELLSFNQVATNDNRNGWVFIFKANTNVSWIKTDDFWKSKNLEPYVLPEFKSVMPSRIFEIDKHMYPVLSKWTYSINLYEYKILLDKIAKETDPNTLEKMKKNIKQNPLYKQEDVDEICKNNVNAEIKTDNKVMVNKNNNGLGSKLKPKPIKENMEIQKENPVDESSYNSVPAEFYSMVNDDVCVDDTDDSDNW